MAGVQVIADRLFVDGVAERPQQADRDRFRAGRQDRVHRGGDRVFGERDQDLAVGIDPLGDLHDAAALHDVRRRRHFVRVALIGAGRAGDAQGVAEPLRGQQSHRGVLLLVHRVGDDGVAQDEAVDRGEELRLGHAHTVPQDIQGAEDPGGHVLGRERLAADHAPVDDRHGVGEGPPDVDANMKRHARRPSRMGWCRSCWADGW
ncbi:hypothetical protein LUX33_49500 [Actinomadura madurae]|nr:hypothetical protein [Actinomadura madurae]MCP9955602.1 hypothetical protein [Actinomadura madurae]